MPAAPINIFMATPVGGGVVAHEYLHNILEVQKHIAGLGWGMEFVTMPDGLVTRSRNAFASYVCRNEKYTHLLMIDADVVISGQGIERLILSGHDVVGAVVPLRTVEWSSVGDYLAEKPDASVADLQGTATRYAMWYEPGQKPVHGFLPVHAIGSAVMSITREALLKISASPLVQYASVGLPAPDKHHDGWTFFDPFVDPQGVYLSEDYALCERWRAIGGTVWADLRSTTRHIGPVPIEGDIAASLESAAKITKLRKKNRRLKGTRES
jgi:hypothetical protein